MTTEDRERLIKELELKEAAFEGARHRDVELAEEIDQLRAQLYPDGENDEEEARSLLMDLEELLDLVDPSTVQGSQALGDAQMRLDELKTIVDRLTGQEAPHEPQEPAYEERLLRDKELSSLLARCQAALDDQSSLIADEMQDLVEDCQVTYDALCARMREPQEDREKLLNTEDEDECPLCHNGTVEHCSREDGEWVICRGECGAAVQVPPMNTMRVREELVQLVKGFLDHNLGPDRWRLEMDITVFVPPLPAYIRIDMSITEEP